ncbi:nanos homolog 1-like [Exaiptasia diaphana]|uniref:Nanos-type domain-containing protein n=1 Tax=Exaiptasia diaphana TaxID=2652724 RepID=A0A913XLW5_EXADI|nr:nanos homolog 1-like [Exaiptasia diaphana]
MGDEMLSVFYNGEIFGPSGSLTESSIEALNNGWSDCTEFHLFRDYFGLIHLVQNTTLSDEEADEDYKKFYKFTYNRTRGDSIGSDRDSISSSGSSGGCPDFDMKLSVPFTSKAVGSSIEPGSHSNRSLANLKRSDIDTAARNRKNRENKKNRNANVCVFCRNNGETKKVYSSHVLKDADGNTTCPILRAYTCPLCKASGNESHTIKYCPRNKNGSKLQAKV